MMKDVQIRVASKSDENLFKNLFNMYYNELGMYCAEFQDVDENGYFDTHAAEPYFSGDGSIMPIVITYLDRTVGFAVLTVPPYTAEGCDFCIQEFFVVGYYRGKGVAKAAAQKLLSLFPGRYCAAVQNLNERGKGFFAAMLKEYGVQTSPYGEEFTLYTALVK